MNSQEFILKIASKNTKENILLSKLAFKKTHLDTTSIYKELNTISERLKKQGYFLNDINHILKDQKKYEVIFSLNEKIDSLFINYKKLPKDLENKLNLKKNSFKISVDKLTMYLEEINKNLSNTGKVFSTVKLTNFKLDHKTLYADLEIKKSNPRIINKIIFRNYEKFPSSFKKNYFNIDKKTVFNPQKLQEISTLSNTLDFANEIKPPEVLFTKDSTYIYMYLKKKQNSSFDGLVNFSSNENGNVFFNGHIDLKLNNIFNTGERLNLFWNSSNNERQEFKTSLRTPYVFNTKITPEISFNIYKQDSTFINTTFESKLLYAISNKSNLSITYNSENSSNFINQIDNNTKSYKNRFLGLGYQYRIIRNDFLKSHKFYFDIYPSFGNRKTQEIETPQIKVTGIIAYSIDINKKNSIYLKNTSGFLKSNNIFTNELFRIGGANSIRGFNEQSIFVKNYTIQNLEYRYTTSKTSYLYSITDIAFANTTIKQEQLLGIGLGYLFKTKNSQINIATISGNNLKEKIKFKNIQFLVSWINFF